MLATRPTRFGGEFPYLEASLIYWRKLGWSTENSRSRLIDYPKVIAASNVKGHLIGS